MPSTRKLLKLSKNKWQSHIQYFLLRKETKSSLRSPLLFLKDTSNCFPVGCRQHNTLQVTGGQCSSSLHVFHDHNQLHPNPITHRNMHTFSVIAPKHQLQDQCWRRQNHLDICNKYRILSTVTFLLNQNLQGQVPGILTF